MERVECSADLLEVVKTSSKSSPWIAGLEVLELWTITETATPRRLAGPGLRRRPDRSDQQFTTTELAKDVQELSASSTWSSGGRNTGNHSDNVIPEAHGDAADDTNKNVKGTDVRKCQVDAEEVDAADVSDKESEGLKRRGEQFLEVSKALEIPMEDTETFRERESS